jgi:hypothetical protein
VVTLFGVGSGLDFDATKYVAEGYRATGRPVMLVHPTMFEVGGCSDICG